MNPRILRTAATGVAVALLCAAPALADGPPVSFSVTVGNPPPVYAPAPVYAPPIAVAPPPMVWLPEVGAYVALGLQQPVFYLGGVYYYRYRGGWYAGPSYGGPWRPAGPPGPLRRFRDPDWARYQRMAREHHGRDNWREFHPRPMRAEPGPRPGDRGRGWEPERGRGPDRGPGRDRGPDRGRDQGRDQGRDR